MGNEALNWDGLNERNCAAADLEKWIITYRIGLCHFSSQCEQFFK